MSILKLGISPCPNDTFIFGHFIQPGFISTVIPDYQPSIETTFEDVQWLNQKAIDGSSLDMIKLSARTILDVQDRYTILESGGAIGYGCGPLLISHRHDTTLDEFDRDDFSVAIPGKNTTAALLLQLFLNKKGFKNVTFQEMRYDRIMPALENKSIDFGVIIHEDRFTYKNKNLSEIIDLGTWWEKETNSPIPLGGIVLSNDIPEFEKRKSQLELSIQHSIQSAWENPETIMPFIREHAQALSDEVIMSHINLYVNDFSLRRGPDGQKAYSVLEARAREARLL